MDKKFVMGIAAMAALTLVSCSSDDLDSLSDNSSKNEAISFDGYLGRSAVAVNGSRGSVATKDKLIGEGKGFGVFGYYNSSDTHNSTEQPFNANLFTNEHVTCLSAGTNWTYSPLKYWPTKGHIDFLAYAPYYNAETFENTYHLKFTVSPTIAEQTDLLWAKADGQTMAKNSGSNKVTFKFNHALSKLGYSVKLNGTCSSDATITLKKITLAGSAPATETASEPTGAFHKTGTIDLSTGTWTPSSDKQYFNWYSAETTGAQSITFTSENSSSTSETYTNKDDEYLFVIPQDFSKTEVGADELYVIVEYTMQYTGVTDPGTNKPAIITNKVYKKLSHNFEQGKAYTIKLTIGRPIDFDVDAEITPWIDGTTIPEIPMD